MSDREEPAFLWEKAELDEPEGPAPSLLGRVTLAGADEAWPHDDEGPLPAVLQLNLESLPFLPPGLEGLTLLTLFGTGPERWCLRTYGRSSALVNLEDPNPGPIWTALGPPHLIEDLPLGANLRDAPRPGIKLGGWPAARVKSRPLLQVDSLPAAGWSWPDGRCAFFSKGGKGQEKRWTVEFAVPSRRHA